MCSSDLNHAQPCRQNADLTLNIFRLIQTQCGCRYERRKYMESIEQISSTSALSLHLLSSHVLTIIQVGTLEVVVPADIIDEETPSDVVVVEGQSVTLQCKATGYPAPKIRWKRKDGQPLPLSREVSSPGEIGKPFLSARPACMHHLSITETPDLLPFMISCEVSKGNANAERNLLK